MRSTIFLLFFLLMGALSNAQTTAEKRTLLANVRRVAVVSPYFGTSTLLGEEPPQEGKAPPPKKLPTLTPEQERQKQAYLDSLRKIEAKLREHLPTRLQKRTAFEVVTQKRVEEAFKALELTPQKLFQSGGRVKNTKFPQGDTEALIKFAKELKADAVLLLVLDEPRKINGSLYASGLGFYFESAHVRAKGGFSLYLSDGKRVLQEPIEVLHPVTKIGNKEFLLTDWLEAHEQMIENFMDELVRYTSPSAS